MKFKADMSPTTSSYHSSSVILSLLVLVLMLLSGCHSQIDCNARENVRACIDKLNMVNFQNHDDSRPNCVNTLVQPVGELATLKCNISMGPNLIFEKWEFHPSDMSGPMEVDFRPGSRFRNNTNELEISDVRPEDEGLYICHFKVNNVRQIQAAGCLIVDAVVEFASPKLQVSAVRGQDITLPTELVFTGSGNCSVRPIVGSVRLVFNEVTRVLCNYNMDCSTKTEALYNFATFGDITIPSSAAEEGVYMLGVEVSCIGQSLPQRDYNVTFTSPSTSLIMPVSTQTASSSVTASVAPSSTGPPGGTRNNPEDQSAVIAIPVTVFLVILIAVIIPLVAIAVWKRSRRNIQLPSKEHVYEVPIGSNNGLGTHTGRLARDDSDYTLPPSTIGGDRNCEEGAPYNLDLVLADKPSDQEGIV